MHEVRADPARPLVGQNQGFAFNARQAADTRTNRAARHQPGFLVHVGQAGILDRLSRGIDAVDDEGIDLALHLVIDPLVGIEAIRVIGRLHFAGDATLLVGCVELRDRSGTGFGSQDVGPHGLDIRAERGDKTKAGYDDATHATLR